MDIKDVGTIEHGSYQDVMNADESFPLHSTYGRFFGLRLACEALLHSVLNAVMGDERTHVDNLFEQFKRIDDESSKNTFIGLNKKEEKL